MEGSPRSNRRPDEPNIEEALRALPTNPRDALGIITAAMAELARDAVLEAQGTGDTITPFAARMIAYSLAAHAPADTETDALQRFYRDGVGKHAELRTEYLPLRLDPDMPPEGHLLVDALGTYLSNKMRGDQGRARARRLGHVSFVMLARNDGTRRGLLFKARAPIGEFGAAALTMKLSRIADDYGDAFLAYLRAPGIDAISDDIRGDFITAYIGGAEELAAIESAPDTVDPAPWNGVEIGGQLYVFHA